MGGTCGRWYCEQQAKVSCDVAQQRRDDRLFTSQNSSFPEIFFSVVLLPFHPLDSSCFSFFSGMSVLTLALCARLSWLSVSFQVHIKSLHIIIIIFIIIMQKSKCVLTRRATNMNQPTENRPTFNICNSSLAHSLLYHMYYTTARLVRVHLDFCTSWGQTQ